MATGLTQQAPQWPLCKWTRSKRLPSLAYRRGGWHSGRPWLCQHPFGDPFLLDSLSSPRRAQGFAVQRLGCDQILHVAATHWLPIRASAVEGLFPRFELAEAAAWRYCLARNLALQDAEMVIVPAAADYAQGRTVLLLGVVADPPQTTLCLYLPSAAGALPK